MNKLYYRIIKFLIKNEYDFKARYLPAVLFTIVFEFSVYCKYFLESFSLLDFIKIPIIIFSSLFLALLPKFCSVIMSGYLQTLYWNKFGNTTIKYIRKSKNTLYLNLLNKFENEDKLMSDMLKVTRENQLLLSKNIFYGFMRNFTFLIFCFLLINIIYFNYFIFENIFVLIFGCICLYVSSQQYAEQILKSYIEYSN